MSTLVYTRPLMPNTVAWPLLATLLLHALIVFLMTVNWPANEIVIHEVDGAGSEADVIEAGLVFIEGGPGEVAPPLTPVKDAPEPEPKTITKPIVEVQIQTQAQAETPPVIAEVEPELVRFDSHSEVESDIERLLGDEGLAPPQGDAVNASYAALIKHRVERNWSRPPGARRGMQVILEIRLTSLGDVASVAIFRSSGEVGFDRSALAAVERAGSFPELQTLPRAEFEKHYRNFRLSFKPEDLRY